MRKRLTNAETPNLLLAIVLLDTSYASQPSYSSDDSGTPDSQPSYSSNDSGTPDSKKNTKGKNPNQWAYEKPDSESMIREYVGGTQSAEDANTAALSSDQRMLLDFEIMEFEIPRINTTKVEILELATDIAVAVKDGDGTIISMDPEKGNEATSIIE